MLYLLVLGWEGMAHKHNLGDRLNGCVTQDPSVGPSEVCAIHSTHADSRILLSAWYLAGVCFRGWYMLYLLVLGSGGVRRKHNSHFT